MGNGSRHPSHVPSHLPTILPSHVPSPFQTRVPTPQPSHVPTPLPSTEPTPNIPPTRASSSSIPKLRNESKLMRVWLLSYTYYSGTEER